MEISELVKLAEENGSDPVQYVHDCLHEKNSPVTYREVRRMVERAKSPKKHEYCLALNLITQRLDGEKVTADVIAVYWGETVMTATTWGHQTQEWIDMMNEERLGISKPEAMAISHCSIFNVWSNYCSILAHFREWYAARELEAKKAAERDAEPEKLPVVYRVFDSGEVIAIFPTIPGAEIFTCSSYMHVGQHSAASGYEITEMTRLATPEEYKDLHEELTQIYHEYELVVYKRIQQWMHDERIAEVRRLSS